MFKTLSNEHLKTNADKFIDMVNNPGQLVIFYINEKVLEFKEGLQPSLQNTNNYLKLPGCLSGKEVYELFGNTTKNNTVKFDIRNSTGTAEENFEIEGMLYKSRGLDSPYIGVITPLLDFCVRNYGAYHFHKTKPEKFESCELSLLYKDVYQYMTNGYSVRGQSIYGKVIIDKQFCYIPLTTVKAYT